MEDIDIRQALGQFLRLREATQVRIRSLIKAELDQLERVTGVAATNITVPVVTVETIGGRKGCYIGQVEISTSLDQ